MKFIICFLVISCSINRITCKNYPCARGKQACPDSHPSCNFAAGTGGGNDCVVNCYEAVPETTGKTLKEYLRLPDFECSDILGMTSLTGMDSSQCDMYHACPATHICAYKSDKSVECVERGKHQNGKIEVSGTLYICYADPSATPVDLLGWYAIENKCKEFYSTYDNGATTIVTTEVTTPTGTKPVVTYAHGSKVFSVATTNSETKKPHPSDGPHPNSTTGDSSHPTNSSKTNKPDPNSTTGDGSKTNKPDASRTGVTKNGKKSVYVTDKDKKVVTDKNGKPVTEYVDIGETTKLTIIDNTATGATKDGKKSVYVTDKDKNIVTDKNGKFVTEYVDIGETTKPPNCSSTLKIDMLGCIIIMSFFLRP